MHAATSIHPSTSRSLLLSNKGMFTGYLLFLVNLFHRFVMWHVVSFILPISHPREIFCDMTLCFFFKDLNVLNLRELLAIDWKKEQTLTNHCHLLVMSFLLWPIYQWERRKCLFLIVTLFSRNCCKMLSVETVKPLWLLLCLLPILITMKHSVHSGLCLDIS